MYDLKTEFDSVLDDVLTAGIKPHVITKLTTSTRTSRRLGLCSRRNGKYSIDVSAFMLADGVDRQALHNTIAHEILHAVDGCFNHGAHWKHEARKLMNVFPQYNITTTTNIASTGAVVKRREYKYYLQCKDCNAVFRKKRSSHFVQHPELYRCSCGGRIVRIG